MKKETTERRVIMNGKEEKEISNGKRKKRNNERKRKKNRQEKKMNGKNHSNQISVECKHSFIK